MRNALLAVLVAVLYALHQDVWFWDEARPLMFGILPIGLAYHIAYCIIVAVLMWVLVRFTWAALSGFEAITLNEEGSSHLEDAR